MEIDVSQFHRLNVADTCAVWNLLSSRRFFEAARSAGCFFCFSQFVRYECLFKIRKSPSQTETRLQELLHKEIGKGTFQSHHLDIEDLQDVAILEKRKNLSKGELSSIAFAKKTQQAFLTDDQKARKLAAVVLEKRMIQTTPHLFGWLFFIDRLSDADKNAIVSEHSRCGRPLAPYFEMTYAEALRCRLMNQDGAVPA